MPFTKGHVPKIKGRDSRVLVSCLSCKCEFKSYDKDRKFCSHTCKGKYWWAKQTDESKKLNIERMVKSEGRAGKIKQKLSELYRGHTTEFKKNKTAYGRYRNTHQWVSRKLGKPDTCQECGRTGLTGHQIHWANISNEYRRESNDWKRLCVPCHKEFDKIRN